MDKDQLKKIIAKEGLILLGCILGGGAIIGLSKLSYHIVYLITKPQLYDNMLIFEPFSAIKKIGLLIAIFGYPLYLFIRFIFWAVKTLKQKEASREVDIKKYIIVGTIILAIFGTIITAGLFNVRRYYEKQKQELSNFNLDREIDRYYAEERRQNEERRQQEALAAQEEYQTREGSRLQRELAMQEEQIRLQKAMLFLQMMQSMPQPQYQTTPSYQPSQQSKRYHYNLRPTIVGPGYPNQSYEGDIQEVK